MQRSFPKIQTQISYTPHTGYSTSIPSEKNIAHKIFDYPSIYFSTDDASPNHDLHVFGKDILCLETENLDPVCELNR